MKVLLHGNAPTVKTGYGIQIAQLAKCLQADGHEVACSATYGIQGGIENYDGIRVYGCGYDTNSNDRLHMHADHWFDGEPGWIITCVDVWAMQNPLLADYNVAAWVPVDHFPLQPNVKQFFEMTAAVPVAMSKFGERMLFDVGLDPSFVPLSVDTNVFRPVEDIRGMTPREMCGLPEDAFVVGMVAMNKGWAKDRKGFNEAFWAFKVFEDSHPDAYLYVHADKWGGAEGQNLNDLAILCGIPPHKIIWSGGPGQYAYLLGFAPEMMAAMYSAFDVLLAPSHGEGFCVPLIEAQACGTPVIATDATAQTELIGVGWKVHGQPEFDPAHHANYICPRIANPIDPRDIAYMVAQLEGVDGAQEVRDMLERMLSVQGLGVLDALELAYEADREEMKWRAVAYAARYDVQKVYDEFWRPFIAQISAEPVKLDLHGPSGEVVEREPMPDENAVAVLCPIYKRTSNIERLCESFLATTEEGEAVLYLVVDEDEPEEFQRAVSVAWEYKRIGGKFTHGRSSFAEKLNDGFAQTDEPWVLVIGDDVVFHDGWLDAARKLSGEFDVIGTNDSLPGRVRNPKVASGAHSDHFFVRRSYVDEYGACLDGPGVLAPEAYRHWFTDVEIVKLAKARGVFSPCLDSVVEHRHPGYDGDEAARQADSTYMKAVEFAAEDEETFKGRLPLIEMARVRG